MMDQFFVWELCSVRYLCMRDVAFPWFASVTIKRLPPATPPTH